MKIHFQEERTMPVIKVWCLPKLSERRLRGIYKRIVAAVLKVTELRLKDEKSLTVLFPADMMKFGLGEKIIVEVTGLFENDERTAAVRDKLAFYLTVEMRELFPKTRIECFIYPFNREQGFCQAKEK